MANDERNTQGGNRGGNDGGGMRGSGSDERMGRGVREGMDAGQSRNAHTSDGSRGDAQGASPGGTTGGGDAEAATGGTDRGSGGYGASSGFSGGTEAAEDESLIEHMERGATPSRTRTGDVGRQAESGLETDPEEGTHGYEGRGRTGSGEGGTSSNR